ncbi:hypothetical protein [Halomonas llamarensis]|uniref:AbrB family transcriptional regulator n=1 Tax=Halomonas llamarensis TaxID=2945104 RepID=A0ABT0SQ36_9GAMM|nr:hypothetical protein [Halomonas llamarensis]MCL7929570.1 hypothetical protein [Halomonas llamarensis]
MYAIEFEADIKNGVVKIPPEYSELQNHHAHIVVMVKDSAISEISDSPLDFSRTEIATFKHQDGVEMQRKMRDEW